MFQNVGYAPDEQTALGTLMGAGAGQGQTNSNVEVIFGAHARKGSVGTAVAG